MKGFIPSAVELSILASMAVLSAAILITSGANELGIILLGFPTILVAGLLGARHTGKLSAPTKATVLVEATQDTVGS